MTRVFNRGLLGVIGGLLMAAPTLAVESNDHLDLSPDGRTIAFDGGERGSKNIYLLDLGSGSCRVLVDMEGDLFVPSWSPDGKFVAFTAVDGDRRVIMVADRETGQTQELVDAGTVSTIAWTPDSARLLFSHTMGDGTADLSFVDIETSQVEPFVTLEGSERFPFWAEALGKYVYAADVTGALELYFHDPETGNRKQLTNDGNNKYAPRIPADGTKVSYAAIIDGHFDLFVMNIDGSDITNLTTQPGHDLFGTWSPDAKTLYFESTRDRGNLDGDNGYDLYAYDFETGKITRITTPETCR